MAATAPISSEGSSAAIAAAQAGLEASNTKTALQQIAFSKSQNEQSANIGNAKSAAQVGEDAAKINSK